MKGLFIYYTSSLFSGLSYNHEWSFFQTDETLFYNGIAGVIAGAVSSAICNPTDVLKVKF